MRLFFALVFAAALLQFNTVSAQDKLQFENLIRQHFDAVKALYSVDKIDHEMIAAFTDQYTDDNFSYKTEIGSNLSKEIANISMEKDEFLKSLRSTENNLLNSKYKYTIISIKISEDGMTADVHFTLLLTGTGQRELENRGLFNIGLKSLSECREKFRYVDEKTIKGVVSDCKIDAIYEKPVPVQ